MEILRAIDESLFFWINNGWATPALDGLMSFFSVAGDAPVLIAFGVITIALWDRRGWRRGVVMFLLTMGLAGLALVGAKAAVDRDRPMERFKVGVRSGKITINAPLRRLYARSFPSGHSQAAFSAAAFFALYYRRRRVLLYGAAFAVALSRVYLGAHFPADIAAGALLGWAVAWLIWRIDPEAPGKSAPARDIIENGGHLTVKT